MRSSLLAVLGLLAVATVPALAAGCRGPASDASAPDASTDAGPPAPTGLCLASTRTCPATLPPERPNRRSEFVFAYDELRHQLVIHGGSTAISMMCEFPAPDLTDETWIYDDECGSWRVLPAAPGASPSPRSRHMAAYDATNDRMITFGGRFRAGASGAYTLYADVWALDFFSETWTLLHPGDASSPAPRTSGALAYDAAAGRLWLFGGNDSTSGAAYGPLQDTWYFDVAGGSWVQVSTGTPGPAPAPRLLHAFTFDPTRSRFLVFAGTDETAFSGAPVYFTDLWSLDTTAMTWSMLDAGTGTTTPPGRFFGAMAYDPAADGYLVFGGHDSTNLGNSNDLWRYEAGGGGWALLRTGDRFNEPITVACSPPVDFAIPDFGAPERRSSHALVTSTSCGHALVFGGKTDCGAIDDVWAYDFAAEVWVNTVDAIEGEACWRRWDGDFTLCNGLCL